MFCGSKKSGTSTTEHSVFCAQNTTITNNGVVNQINLLFSLEMASNRDKWIRIFDLPETSRHKNGFTIYKIVSMLYPENCPEAVTKVTVWKRFNDLKKLYREIKVLHRKLGLKNKLPSLAGGSIFKRFDEDTIRQRKESILVFLEFVASQWEVFMSNEVVKFFRSSHTPMDHLDSNINVIRANLELPEDSDFGSSLSINSDTSETDSITTISSCSTSIPNDIEHPKLKKLNSLTTISDTLSLSSVTLLDGQIYPTPPETPAGSEAGQLECVQYIVDASVHISLAVELEQNHKFEEAFTAYKAAIDILIKFGKDDTNYDRRQLVRYKTDKYLIRAEKIYNMHLAPEIKNLQVIQNSAENPQVKRPLIDLYKYKVVKVIGSGMLVLHSELQQLYYVKVIHKSMQFLNENLILPENVPFSVRLHNHYNCDNALFLVLEYSNGTPLPVYLKQRSHESLKTGDFLKHLQEVSDNDSENSYSDLINEYKTVKEQVPDRASTSTSSDDFVKVDLPVDTKPSISRQSSQEDFLEEIESTNRLPEELVRKWAAQLLLALDKLHTLGIVCKDLSAKNVLIEQGNLVLTYFCNVKELGDLYSGGINLNLAPEVYSFGPVGQAADWWSFGAILYELLVGLSLEEVHPGGLTSFRTLQVPKYVSPEGRSILKQLLVFEENDRLGKTENVKTHPFFIGISWEALLASCGK